MCRQFSILIVLAAGIFYSAISLCGYTGSHAYNNTSQSTTSVNTATGTFHFSYPLIKASGIHLPFTINLTYSFNVEGMFGLPNGWRLDIDYIDGKIAQLSGKQWLIDNKWNDETLTSSGLKYFNQHGTKFIDEGQEKNIPEDTTLFYRYKSCYKDGSVKYFSHQGLLVLELDRYGNKVYLEYEQPVSDLHKAKLSSIKDNYGNFYRFSYEPNSLIIHYPDGRKQTVYYSAQGVNTIVNPMGQRFDLSYVYRNGYSLIRTLKSPTGLGTELTYDSVPYKQDGKSKSMPVVIGFMQFDWATNKIHHQTHYSFTKGKNYTGFPLYELSSSSDSLMDSDDKTFHYTVEVKQTDGELINPNIHHKVYEYNFLHLPIEVRTLKNGKNFIKVRYQYEISPFKYSRITNYDKPAKVIHETWNEQLNDYIPSNRVDNTYDRYGNKTHEEHWVYSRDDSDWHQIRSLTYAYFTEHYSLLSETLDTDKTTGKTVKTAYRLTPSNKSHAAKLTFYQENAQASWRPWQQIDFQYDDKGREVANKLKWLAEGMPGVQSTEHYTHYLFDPSTAVLTTQHESSLGNISQTLTDTRNNQTIAEISAMGDKNQYFYNAIGQRTEVIDPEGNSHKTSYQSYDQYGCNTHVTTTPLGFTQQEHFDASGRLIKREEMFDGRYVTLEEKAYNAFGKLTIHKDQFGQVSTHEYDDSIRLIRVVDPWNNKTDFHYDDDNLTQLISHNGRPYQKIIKTPWQQKVEKINFPVTNDISIDSVSKVIIKNGFNLKIKEVSSLINTTNNTYHKGITSRYYYDAGHNPLVIETQGFDGLQSTKHTQYDLFNNVFTFVKTQTINDKKDTRSGYRYAYNSDNQLISVTSPESQHHDHLVTRHRYNKDGREIEKELSDGHIIKYEYNPRGLIQSVSFHRLDKPYKVSHHYDADSRLIQTKDSENQSLHYQYDERGLLTHFYYPDGNVQQYLYDAHHRLIKQTNVGHSLFSYEYHPEHKGKLSKITTGNDQVTFTYGEDDNGMKGQLLQLDREFSGSGKTQEVYTYGPYGRLSSSSVTIDEGILLLANHYLYQPRGELVEHLMEAVTNDNKHVKYSVNYQYDSFKRLINEMHLTTSISDTSKDDHQRQVDYQYDSNNNLVFEKRSEEEGNAQTIARFYNPMDQLVAFKCDDSSAATEIIHDANGRLQVDDKGRHYQYDDLGLLQSIRSADGKNLLRFSYLPNGLLGVIHKGNTHQDFYYDGGNRIQSVFKDNGWQDLLSYRGKIIGSVSQTVTNQVFFSNQSTAAQTGLDEQSNKTSAFYTYDGYGRMTSLGKIPDNQRIDFLWNQLLLEQVSGLTYMQHRFYHSFFKRFISRDKLNVENCYTYAHGNPVTLIDPSGLNAQQVMNYGLGTGFSILGVLGAIFAFPTGGASLLTLSAAAGIGAGISTALSGLSLMGSQAALDSGNKAAAKALQYTSMGLGVLATVEGVVAIAPSVADFFGYQSRYLTRYLGFWHTPRVVVDKWINMFSILEEQPNFFPDNMTDWTIKEITEITGTSTDIEKEEEIANFLKKVRDWHKSWQISRSSAAGYDVVNKEVYRYAPVKERLASQSFGRSPSTVRGLGRSEFPPRISTSTKFSKYVKNHIADITEKLGGDASLAKEWYRSGRYKGQITSILEE